MAAAQHYDATLAWVSEVEPAACTVLANLHPDVPNLGDLTTVDWSTVEPVDILTAGYPCQPFSHAGKRKGADDERHLWPYIAAAIGALRPRVVVLENVLGHVSMGLADVIGDLAALGYDARWGVVRASDAGAPHQRARIFIVAADTDGTGLQGCGLPTPVVHAAGSSGAAADSRAEPPPDTARGPGRTGQGRRVSEPEGAAGLAAHDLSVTADADTIGFERSGGTRRRGCGPKDDGGPTADTANQEQREPAVNGPLRPEPRNGADAGPVRVEWGKYEPAIRRWEQLTRPAPAPTVLGRNDRPRLSPYFVEWMMGLDASHVTGHGLTIPQTLKMLGNGVVPQQALLALRLLAVAETLAAA